MQHKINIGQHPPVHQPPYNSTLKPQEIIDTQVGRMMENDVVEPLQSPFTAPVVLIQKPDGTWRFCVDYRKLNTITIRDTYPLSQIEDALSRLEGSKDFSIMDMQSVYWQVQMKSVDRERTAFITANGLYQFKVMPFGLTNAPRTF